jgi:hypothetical protein
MINDKDYGKSEEGKVSMGRVAWDIPRENDI